MQEENKETADQSKPKGQTTEYNFRNVRKSKRSVYHADKEHDAHSKNLSKTLNTNAAPNAKVLAKNEKNKNLKQPSVSRNAPKMFHLNQPRGTRDVKPQKRSSDANH